MLCESQEQGLGSQATKSRACSIRLQALTVQFCGAGEEAGQAGQGNVRFECAERHCKVILSWACFGQLVASELQLRAL
jgi:hypothetical protein